MAGVEAWVQLTASPLGGGQRKLNLAALGHWSARAGSSDSRSTSWPWLDGQGYEPAVRSDEYGRGRASGAVRAG